MFKRKTSSEVKTKINFAKSGKRKSFLDFFKIDVFILTYFIFSILLSIFLFYITTQNEIEIDTRTEKIALDYARLQEYSSTIGFLNWLSVQQFNWDKVVKIINYLDDMNLYSYELEFDSLKQYFFVNLKNINETDIASYIDLWLKQGVLNYKRTNETIKITEEGKISIMLIFN